MSHTQTSGDQSGTSQRDSPVGIIHQVKVTGHASAVNLVDIGLENGRLLELERVAGLFRRHSEG